MKTKMLGWADQFDIFCFLDNHDYSIQPQQYECLLGAGAIEQVSSNSIKDIDGFIGQNQDWVFGHLAYELKNSIFDLASPNTDKIGFPDFFFFRPEFLLEIKGHDLIITAHDPDLIYRQVLEQSNSAMDSDPVVLRPKLSREEYTARIIQLKKHILRGDCYEINFCQEFFAEQVSIDPVTVYRRLALASPNPFCALYKLHQHYLICASPERFLAKKGDTIISQPMKGTIKRDTTNKERDEALKNELKQSVKDRSENVMVVDMVRNDLSRICQDASVKVEELFGVYTYPQVHQMISTIRGQLEKGITFSEIIEATFPMGSMTGAPKQRVVELIDQYEVSARGIFSGSVGYINPAGDFDFNVVIRSIMYNSDTGYLSCQLGSGITFYSDPEKEWEECLLKGEAIKKVLTT